LRTGVAIVAIERCSDLAGAVGADILRGTDTAVSVAWRPVRERLCGAARGRIACIDGARVAVVASSFIDVTVAVVVGSVAQLGTRRLRVADGLLSGLLALLLTGALDGPVLALCRAHARALRPEGDGVGRARARHTLTFVVDRHALLACLSGHIYDRSARVLCGAILVCDAWRTAHRRTVLLW
jgi:hypothetical protein